MALDAVSADFRPGEIHAVLGENGAGKSTLVGILGGFVTPDSGTVTLDGKSIPMGRAFECKRLGIEQIHQHFTLVGAFTVAENFALARLPGLASTRPVAELARPSLAAAERLGWPVEPEARVGDLSVGAQQRLEILKALGGDARVVLFDEPTAVLSPDEVEDLFRVLRQLRDEGRVVILIAHKLSEVMAIADRVTVLRRGKWVASCAIGETNPTQLSEWMVGEMPAASTDVRPAPQGNGIRAKDLHVLGDRGAPAIRGIDFQIQRGEVLGFGGVDGNGQVELAEALAAVRPHIGELLFDATPISPDKIRIAYIPQDRHHDGLALGMSIQDNLLITGHRHAQFAKGPFLILRAVRAWAQELIDRFQIKADGPAQRVSGLSGGNQQKVVVARALERQPDLLVAVNPTRGLDIRATEYVQRMILQARDLGAAVALISTDLDELAALSDRTLFLSRGELAATVVGDA